MEIDESYFEGEERDGFFIEGMMKRAWAAQLEVLKVIEEVCKKKNLRYFAEWGTLLGAVRHQGFIPWDDDIDIIMPREDYVRFLEIAKKELPETYVVLSVDTEEKWLQPFARVTNERRINYTGEHLERYHGCPYVVGLDIFPLDYISKDKEAEKAREQLLQIIIATRKMLKEKHPEAEHMLERMEQVCGVNIRRDASLERQLLVLFDQMSQLFAPEECDEVAPMFQWIVRKNGIRQKSWYEKMLWAPFEMTEIAVPDHAHDCVRGVYGERYMIPKRVKQHDYPFYARQERIYQEWLKNKNAEAEQYNGAENCS